MPQHHRRRLLCAALVALAVGGFATACGDAPTSTQSGGKLHVTQGARHDEFGDPPTLDPIVIIAEPDPPPPQFDDPWGPCGPTACDDPSNDPCSIDPWACGYDTPPDPFDPSTEPGDVPGNTAPPPADISPSPVGDNEFKPDCRYTACPSGQDIITDVNVQKAAKYLSELSKQDHIEHGAFLYITSNGTIVIGPILDGNATSVPQLANGDMYAIGSIHSHPPGSQYLEGPSGNDVNQAVMNDYFAVIATQQATYIIGPDGTPLYKTAR